MLYDLIVIGSGPAGYEAAAISSKNGLKTLVLEMGRIGGVCLNEGCIPTKSLINTANHINNHNELSSLFIETAAPNISTESVKQMLNTLTANMRAGVEFIFKKNKVEFLKEEVVRITSNEVITNANSYNFRYLIIASGSSNKPLHRFIKGNIDMSLIYTSRELLQMDRIPQEITVIGGGAIGVEFSYILNFFGSKVQILEYMPTLIPNMDTEGGKYLERVFKRYGIVTRTGCKLISIEQGKDTRYLITFESNGETKHIETDAILNAMGRSPNTSIDGLVEAGIEITDNGFIKTDSRMQTNNKNIYAIGDVVAGTPMLAHTAYDEARTAAYSILSKENSPAARAFETDYTNTPYCIYTEPEIASFGSLEKSDNNTLIKVHFKSSGKANAIHKNDGFIKVSYNNETGVILGALIVGYGATELIHQLIILSRNKIDIKKAGDMQYAHPTFSESLQELFKAASGEIIH